MGRIMAHDEVNQLLPWLVNDSLTERERQQVLLHVRDCRACQRERDRLQEMEALFAEDDQPLKDYHFAFRKLQRRIEAAEQAEIETPYARQPRWQAWAVAASVLVLVGTILLPFNEQVLPDSQTFRTLTSPAAKLLQGDQRNVEIRLRMTDEGEAFKALLIETQATLKSEIGRAHV